MDYLALRNISYQCLLELATSEGLNASATTEAYGCVFGRDSALTVLKLLNVYKKTNDERLLSFCRNGLLALISLQGKTENIESGEQPGKIIHEFRKDNYERLINRPKPWYVYEDGMLRNYDSVDSTPLTLIALYKYWSVTGDDKFLSVALPCVEKGLQWLMMFGDRDGDSFVEYELPVARKYGGLTVQSWTDSQESLLQVDGTFPDYPIAPVEVQAYAWLSYKLWSTYYIQSQPALAKKLIHHADVLKTRFNRYFVHIDTGLHFGIQALDGRKAPIRTVTANPLLCLWASFISGNRTESIIKREYIEEFVQRGFQPDLFDYTAGIRTMSTLSPTFNPSRSSYHNGSFWPILNGLIHEGLSAWGFTKEADKIKQATLVPISHFGFPIELYIKQEDRYEEFVSHSGKPGCRNQAWTAAATLDMVT